MRTLYTSYHLLTPPAAAHSPATVVSGRWCAKTTASVPNVRRMRAHSLLPSAGKVVETRTATALTEYATANA
eukprot:gene14519-biopygen578